MDQNEVKLETFTAVVMQQASEQRHEILDGAEARRREAANLSELRSLQDAHDRIQDAMRRMGKASNEEISRTIVESKQALFTRREEIIDGIMANVRSRLAAFRAGEDYPAFLRSRMECGLQELGDGEILVLVDPEDISLAGEIASDMKRSFEVRAAEETLSGGCFFINRSTGRMMDYSLERSMQMERNTFLQHYNLSIEG